MLVGTRSNDSGACARSGFWPTSSTQPPRITVHNLQPIATRRIEQRRSNAISLQTVLIEDSNTIREALIPALADLAEAEVVAVAETASEAVTVLEKLGDTWDLAVVDLFLREGSGLTVLRTCKDRAPH